MKKQYRKILLLLLSLFTVVGLVMSIIINSPKVSADSMRELMVSPDLIMITKVGAKDEDNPSMTDELRELLEGAEFQVLNSNGKPIRFAKMSDTLSDQWIEVLSSKSDSLEQKKQFDILKKEGHSNYYRSELITQKIWDKGYMSDQVYELQKNALYPGGIPDESEYKDTVTTTKDSPLILGIFPETPKSIKYIIGDTEVLMELIPHDCSAFLRGENPKNILLFFMDFSEEMTIKETKAPEGYNIIDPITFKTDAYVVGWNEIDSLDNYAAIEEKFLQDSKAFGAVIPQRLLEETQLSEKFIDNLNTDEFFGIKEELEEELGDINQNLRNNSLPKNINLTLEDPKKTNEISYIDVSVEKKWKMNDESHLEDVTVNLYKNNEITDQKIILNKENGWKSKFKNLPLQDDNFAQNVYTVREEGELEGKININDKWFDVSYEGNMENGYTITNKENKPWKPIEPRRMSIDVKKVWVGKEQESVTVNLLADGEKVSSVVLSVANDWKHTFTNLPVVYDTTDEKAIEYSVEELEIDGYESLISGSAEGGFVITNTEVPKPSDPIPKAPKEEKLPQTGEPVNVLAYTGVTLIISGLLILITKRSIKE